jgi:DNA-binding response OmpR family regulator
VVSEPQATRDERAKGRILIIDDDQAVRGAQMRLLERAGYDVREAASAFAGLDIAREWPPDLIMLDIAMPTVSGLEALKVLKAKPATRDALIVAFSAFITDGEEVRYRRIGFDHILPKPLSAEELLSRVGAFRRGRGAT